MVSDAERATNAGLPSEAAPTEFLDHDGEPELVQPNTRKTANSATPIALCDWQDEKVVRNVVAIHFYRPHPFDTEWKATGQGSGFVVDPGYILTNRHVVGPGPFSGYCVLSNHEEVKCHPCYIDPVHDFALLKYDLNAIRHAKLDGLDLKPDQANVGSEIRVVGNDAGGQISVSPGVISRLDLNAPSCDGYSDFNSCYYQASAGLTTGSSGSPVVIKSGAVVAMSAGRFRSSHSQFFLPIERPLRALRCLQENRSVTRGDIQTRFLLRPFDKCRQLGLKSDWESTIRKERPEGTSMLVAELVLPEGPAYGKIREGDVLVKVNGTLLTDFPHLDNLLDSNVGSTIRVLLQREGNDVEVEIEVGDLHKITPDRFVSIATGIFHDLSYQMAMKYAVAVKGVFTRGAQGYFNFKNQTDYVIQSVNDKEIFDLATFIEAFKAIPDQGKAVIKYRDLSDSHTLCSTVIHIDRHWFPDMKLWVRNDETGLWDFELLGEPLPPVPPEKQSANLVQLENMPTPELADLVRSFVRITCRMPYVIDGYSWLGARGMGLVVDADQGHVVVSREIVPHHLTTILITIAGSIEVSGEVIFTHPLQNWAIIKYDPLLVEAPVKSARFSSKPLAQGMKTHFLGYDRDGNMSYTPTKVTSITTKAIPIYKDEPRYRPSMFSAITIDSSLADESVNGVLAAPNGLVQALWLSYIDEGPEPWINSYGLHTHGLLSVISTIQRGERPMLRGLPAEFEPIPMSEASSMGVSDEWIKKMVQENKQPHQLFKVSRQAFEPTEPGVMLMEGDIVLRLDGKMCTEPSSFNMMFGKDVIDTVIVRNRDEMHLKLPTVSMESVETDRVVFVCGATLQRPHLVVRHQTKKVGSEVYISHVAPGSPARQSVVKKADLAAHFVTHVNGKSTTDLDAFVIAIRAIPHDEYFRLRVVSLNNVPGVITMKMDRYYFPMEEWSKDSSGQWGYLKDEGRMFRQPQGILNVAKKTDGNAGGMAT